MRWRNAGISLFVIAWTAVFHYETLRLNYLSPLIGRELPKLKFLFPPAGWIMFFNVDRSYGFAEVIGFQEGRPILIDPHLIFETRFVGYDNIRRNVLVSALSLHQAPRFCAYLKRKFPQMEGFDVVYAVFPDVVNRPTEKLSEVAYRCR
jgi:hypothetical protein